MTAQNAMIALWLMENTWQMIPLLLIQQDVLKLENVATQDPLLMLTASLNSLTKAPEEFKVENAQRELLLLALTAQMTQFSSRRCSVSSKLCGWSNLFS